MKLKIKHKLQNLAIYIIFRKIISYFFCNYKKYEILSKDVWEKRGVESLLFPPITYNIFQSILSRLTYRNLCYAHDNEFGMYGHGPLFMRFATGSINEDYAKHITIEHGNILNENADGIAPVNTYLYKGKLVLTYSEQRVIYLNKIGLKAKAIGPYIHYAKNRVSQEIFESIKQKLGRMVLFFPNFAGFQFNTSLGTTYNAQHEHNLCMNTLLSWKKEGKVDSIVVCYRLDDFSKYMNIYSEIGAIPACCGDIRNPFYMDHLKFLIDLSNFTASNKVSTPLGYSLYMKKQHFIIGDYESRLNNYQPTDEKSVYLFEKLYRNVAEIVNIEDDITAKVAKWWGFDNVLEENELRKILLD